MRVQVIGSSLLVAGLCCLPAGASQPQGRAGKMISNPFIEQGPVGENGLPQVGCFGFTWLGLFNPRQADPADTVTLELAIIPFRSGFTEVHVHDQIRLQFKDGLVNGLPYKRGAWNDVRAVIRASTRDYMLTVNGVQAGPFPNEYPCPSSGECLRLAAVSVRGAVFEESTAWIDSLSLVLDSAAGGTLIDKGFDGCYESPNVYLGGLIITEPPARLSLGGTR